MIAIGTKVRLTESQYPLGKVETIYSDGRCLIRLASGGTLTAPIHLLSPAERTTARKSAPRRRD